MVQRPEFVITAPLDRIQAHPLGELPPSPAITAVGHVDALPLDDRASHRDLPAPDGAPERAHGFHLAVEQDAETLLLKLSGDFDVVGVGRLEATTDRALRLSTRRVVFDLSDVTFLDMAGLVSLMRMDERAREASFDVQILPPRGLARRVFTLTRAGEQLTMITVAPTVGPNRA